MAKTAKRDEGWREVTVEVADVEFRPRVTFRFNSGESVTVRGSDLDFPKWRLLIPADSSRMGTTVGVAYDPSRLVPFTKVRPNEGGARRRVAMYPTVSSNGRPGPTAVRIGDNFTGVVFPERPDDDGPSWSYARPDWLAAPASVAASGTEGGR